MGLLDFLKPKPDPLITEMETYMDRQWDAAFPRGLAQVEEEAALLLSVFPDKLSQDQAQSLIGQMKLLSVMSKDKSEDQIVKKLLESDVTDNLTAHEVKNAYQILVNRS